MPEHFTVDMVKAVVILTKAAYKNEGVAPSDQLYTRGYLDGQRALALDTLSALGLDNLGN